MESCGLGTRDDGLPARLGRGEYLTEAEVAADLDRIDHVIGALWKLTRKRLA